MSDLTYAASKIRTINDWPTPGIIFKDITPLLSDPKAMKAVVTAICELDGEVDLIAGIEARGFVFASAVANELNKGFIPIRKKGKLPFTTHSQEYGLEYGQGILEIHTDAIHPGQKVLLIDDVLATGGTLTAAAQLIEKCGGVVPNVVLLLEIAGLPGREKYASLFPNSKLTVLF
jgi:adenine phosphoribosyltransferase